MMRMQEPWLRGPLPNVDPMVAPLLMSFQMAREDLGRFAGGLSAVQLWEEPYGLPSVGFQIRHITGSVDRLCTYLAGRQISELQLQFLRREAEPGAKFEALIAAMDEAFARCEAIVRSVEGEDLTAARSVGRKQLPTTVIGLIVHIAEHTQRHVGQAITTAKLVGAFSRKEAAGSQPEAQ